MSNLTLVIDDDLLRAARIKALQQGTSVNEICREAIARFAAPPVLEHDDFLIQLQALSQRASASLPMRGDGAPADRLPSRNEMMEQALAERLPTLMATTGKKK